MGMQRLCALASIYLLACGCGGGGAGTDAGGATDAGLDGGPGTDASGTDASGTDASGTDAGVAMDSGSGSDAAPAPPLSVLFTRPADSCVSDTTIEDEWVGLIDATPPGELIRVAMYNWSRVPVAAALVAAASRGVDVRVIVDGGAATQLGDPTSAMSILSAGLAPGALTFCTSAGGTSCLGTVINHNKFLLLSALDDGTLDVVVQSSANLTTSQTRQHNNAVVIRGDATLYGAYLQYWNDLETDAASPNYYWSIVGDLATKAYFFPRNNGGDTIVSILGNVECSPGARIRIAMAHWTDARLAIVAALESLAALGCTVEVITREGNEVTDDFSPAIDLWLFPDIPCVGSSAIIQIHSKYLLIDAPYGTTPPLVWRRLLWTGSHNYTGNALHNNDEVLLRIEDDPLFDAFSADWEDIRDRIDALP